MPTPRLEQSLQTRQRMTVLGRLRMAEWVRMPEAEFAREVEKIEKDPLFQKLFFGSKEVPAAIRRQRWPGGRLSSRFYEMKDHLISRGDRVQVEAMLEGREKLVSAIRRLGRENFERYFIYAEEPLSLEEIAARAGVPPEEVRRIHEFLLEMGSRAQFESDRQDPGMLPSYACVAQISLDGGEPVFHFNSPYWARGLYQLSYGTVERWKSRGGLKAEERRRLPRLLRRIEQVNLRQNTLFRVLESSVKIQARSLGSGKGEDRAAISLRQLARRLDLAPSTVSRALAGRSVRLPDGTEAPLRSLLPGRRRVVRDILARWLSENRAQTDAALAARLKSEHAIKISRRTVNAVRRGIAEGKKQRQEN